MYTDRDHVVFRAGELDGLMFFNCSIPIMTAVVDSHRRQYLIPAEAFPATQASSPALLQHEIIIESMFSVDIQIFLSMA